MKHQQTVADRASAVPAEITARINYDKQRISGIKGYFLKNIRARKLRRINLHVLSDTLFTNVHHHHYY